MAKTRRSHMRGRSSAAQDLSRAWRAALLEHHAFGEVSVCSAGSMPTCTIPNTVTDALAEVGIELTAAFPEPLTDEVVHAADVVVTMGCGNACLVAPGKRYLYWDVRGLLSELLHD